MQIKNVPIKEIIPYPRNNRIHSEEQINRIANSIQDFGFNQPLVVDEGNVILVGHGRLSAAQKLGLKEVPVYKIGGLTPAQKKAYRILDNKLQNDSTWNIENLPLELQELRELGFDFERFGLEELEVNIDPDPEVEDDEFEGDGKPKTNIKNGDEIALGNHALYCLDVQKMKLPIAPCALWITDPPYGVSYVGKTKDALTIESDDMDEDELRQLWEDATAYALKCLRDGGACYATVPAGKLNLLFAEVWMRSEILRQQLVWAKDSMVLGHSDYHYKHEPILYGWKPGAEHYFTPDRTRVSVLEYARPKASREHPTMKPLDLWAELIRNSTKKGDIVLDTFMGSGTTIIACEALGRIAVGCEKDPQYCQVIVNRYIDYCGSAGRKAVVKINGKPYAQEI